MAEVSIAFGMAETSPVAAQTRTDDDLERSAPPPWSARSRTSRSRSLTRHRRDGRAGPARRVLHPRLLGHRGLLERLPSALCPSETTRRHGLGADPREPFPRDGRAQVACAPSKPGAPAVTIHWTFSSRPGIVPSSYPPDSAVLMKATTRAPAKPEPSWSNIYACTNLDVVASAARRKPRSSRSPASATASARPPGGRSTRSPRVWTWCQ
jgi:hypothetical protein